MTDASAQVAFSLISRASYENVKHKWWPELKHHCPGVPMLLVGTKLDLRSDVNTIAKLREKNQTPISFDEGIEQVRCTPHIYVVTQHVHHRGGGRTVCIRTRQRTRL